MRIVSYTHLRNSFNEMLCVLLRRVLHMVLMARGHNRTSTVTEVLLGAVLYYMDMLYFGSASP